MGVSSAVSAVFKFKIGASFTGVILKVTFAVDFKPSLSSIS